MSESRYSERAGFLMGNPDREQSEGLTVVAIGSVPEEAIAPLALRVTKLRHATLPLDPAASLEAHPAETNAAIDAAPSHWVLFLREGETVTDSLAQEIVDSAVEPPVAWGFRIERTVRYRGRPLRIRGARGEIRLIHRRHARFDVRTAGREMKVQGPVIRLREPLIAQTFDSTREHRDWLAQRGIAHSTVRRLLLFCVRAMRTGAWRSSNTLSWLWIESAFDRGGD